MSLFQKSVVQKYLNDLDSDLINNKYAQFQSFFADPVRQENIRNSKEEQFQEGFLRELFVKVFGYTLNPEPDYNLTTELKNISNSKKADGAILNGKDAIGVIELKGTDTTDLDKIETQAFGYKNHHPKCVYVITSNFEKLRFYIQNAVDHIDFDLFNLSQEDFSLMWLCLAMDNLLNDIPQKIKDSSLLQEESITKKLYADYSKFREEIYNNLVENNPDKDKLLLFKKTQKLLDRFLFIFFAEDRLLLPPNSISEIVKQWDTLKDLDAYVPLYDRFKLYFSYMNTGYKGKKYDIYAYNGGLFAPDEILDSISIDDEILHKHTLKLSQYDFETDVDVNILGHIFEHSLGEIENVQAEIKGEKIDTQKTKRKKDGIFYTPKYITKYIVENTVGKLCEEKRSELDIVDEEYAKGRRNRKKDTIKALDNKLTEYRNWLLRLTILDPACGSGAFLNQALDFLITEHRKIDDLRAQLLGGSIVFSDITTDILEKNIYGVDLNEESVEIAKLSLWLRTAQKGRKLNKLNNNIKCGNSLIDDHEVAGEKAFNWENEFPQVFAKGGFDVVIGNPPYVRHERIKEIKPFLEANFKCYNNTSDLYTYFYEKGLRLLSNKGVFGFITPNKFIESNYGINLRLFLNSYNIIKIVDFGELPVFEDAATFPCVIFIDKTTATSIRYSKIDNLKFSNLNNVVSDKQILVNRFTDSQWQLVNIKHSKLLKKLSSIGTSLNEYVNGEIKFGIKTGFNEAYVINREQRKILINAHPLLDQIIRPFVNGNNVRKYRTEDSGEFIIMVKKGTDLAQFPKLIEHFSHYRNKLEKRSDKGDYWYDLRACSYYDDFDKPKILYPDIALESRFTIDSNNLVPNATLFMIPRDDKYLLGILNSKTSWYYLMNICPVIGDKTNRGRLRLKTIYIKKLPIVNADDGIKNSISSNVDALLMLNNSFQNRTKTFIKYISSSFNFVTLTKKLENWPNLVFSDFIKELNNAIKKSGGDKLSKSDEMEWMELFETKKAEAQAIKSEIEKTDKEIDQMVYELYGLTDDEIAIIENS